MDSLIPAVNSGVRLNDRDLLQLAVVGDSLPPSPVGSRTTEQHLHYPVSAAVDR